MFDTAKVKDIAVRGKKEQWPYPQLFNALKDAGVEFYDTKVANREVTYHGDRHRWMDNATHSGGDLKIAPSFNEPALMEAIRKNQITQTTNAQFLVHMAAAGVSAYRVDTTARTVTYSGTTSGAYVDKVPAFESSGAADGPGYGAAGVSNR